MSAQKISKIIILFFIFIFLVIGSLLFILNQPKLLADLAIKFLKNHSSEVQFEEISLKGIRWLSWQNVKLTDLRIKCRIKNLDYLFTASQVDFDHLKGLLGNNPLLIEIKKSVITSESLNIPDLRIQAQLYFEKLKYLHSQVHIEAPQLNWGQYSIDRLSSLIDDHNGNFKINKIDGHFYGGDFQGQGNLQYKNGLTSDIRLQLKDVDTSLIAQVNGAFNQFTAILLGSIKIQSSKDKGLLIEADMSAPLGGSMKASLLRFLAQYVPQKRQIEDLIIKDADVSLSKAQIQITSVDQDNIRSEVRLNSSSLNLNMKVKFDIHVEGGIESLLQYHT